ncbi:heavy-metal-associated domain-containing protein [Maribacter sp. HTCC2170]|uniref:heavy-metal-associated domain-containing protein n=1 Tax=Maribacter sp. (strain HTCC2170 / KCCM 42371) TaxID=313603 RepID=UPI0002F027E2|nr:heavy metal-associated domain-containing protein [Maribacter sp. HTCC2170]
MKHTYNITGMTCNGCVASVSSDLIRIEGVLKVDVSLENGEVYIESDRHILLGILQSAISEKYKIYPKRESSEQSLIDNGEKSKWRQLRPLFLIFIYLFSAVILLNFKNWNTVNAMMDFMGLFFIVFSFFKLLDFKGFPDSFKMYDPLAKLIPAYGWVYPFIELVLGLMFLMRFQVTIALIVTIVILGLTTIGVTKVLLDKKSIQCACLGTALKLPMTEATFIENAIMLIMALSMLFMNVV